MNHCCFGLRIILSVSVPGMYLLVLTLKDEIFILKFYKGGMV